MRRIIILILCCMLLVGAVYADNRADTIRNTATVYADGSARMTLTARVTLDDSVSGLTFPLPAGADAVTLNGTPVEPRASRTNPSVVLVDLSHLDGITGTQELVFTYTLPALVAYDEKKEDLQLQVPLLSGFDYPIKAMSFSITLPDGVDGIPNFYSGYFLQSIESDLNYTFNNGVISGSVTETMKDKETLMMTMKVTQALFPDLVIIENEENLHLYAMSAMAGAALLFWIAFLHSLPVFRRRCTAPPAGIHAGEIGSRLTMEGADLTMMVFHWAQLGYLRIAPNKRGGVWLHKRMDMGNERSPFEVKCFNQLFGRNRSVEGTGSRYARLWQSVSRTLDRSEQITPGGLGARSVFRFLAMLVSTLAGLSMGANLVEEGPWKAALAVVLALAGSFAAWKIQAGFLRLHLRRREALPLSLVCCLLWLLAALLTDRPIAGLFSTAVQILAGIFTAWGGRRTKSGYQTARDILGLRCYLASPRREELKEALNRNPDYFFEMMPYAMAFGVDEAFAKRFGRRILPQCSYLDADRAAKRNARDWALIMRQTAKKLDDTGRQANTYRTRR